MNALNNLTERLQLNDIGRRKLGIFPDSILEQLVQEMPQDITPNFVTFNEQFEKAKNLASKHQQRVEWGDWIEFKKKHQINEYRCQYTKITRVVKTHTPIDTLKRNIKNYEKLKRYAATTEYIDKFVTQARKTISNYDRATHNTFANKLFVLQSQPFKKLVSMVTDSPDLYIQSLIRDAFAESLHFLEPPQDPQHQPAYLYITNVYKMI